MNEAPPLDDEEEELEEGHFLDNVVPLEEAILRRQEAIIAERLRNQIRDDIRHIEAELPHHVAVAVPEEVIPDAPTPAPTRPRARTMTFDAGYAATAFTVGTDKKKKIPVHHPDRGQRIIVRGDKITLVNSDVLAEMSFGAFASNFLHSNPPEFDQLLPLGTRLVRTYGDQVRFLIELEPSVQTMKVRLGETTETIKPFAVAIPWQYFYFVFRRNAVNVANIPFTFLESRLFWAPRRINFLIDGSEEISEMYNRGDISGREDWVTPAKLPNIYRDAKICFGNTAPDSTMPLAQRIEAVINDFFSPDSVFNNDLGWNLPAHYSSFLSWQRDSKIDPMCFLKWREFERWEYGMGMGGLFPKAYKADITIDSFSRMIRERGTGSF